MTPGMRKGLIVAVIHILMVASLGGKLLVDRATRPRVWARTVPFDPDLPIRGRYVRLRIEGNAPDIPAGSSVPVKLDIRDQALIMLPTEDDKGLSATLADPSRPAVLDQPLAYFIPEHIPDPSVRLQGEELWVEVTLPRRGPPRPIRLGVKKDGVLTPLD